MSLLKDDCYESTNAYCACIEFHHDEHWSRRCDTMLCYVSPKACFDF